MFHRRLDSVRLECVTAEYISLIVLKTAEGPGLIHVGQEREQ
jgi:hypothetical protein